MVVTRDKLREVVAEAVDAGIERDDAIRATAQLYDLPLDTVLEAVTLQAPAEAQA